MASCGDYQLYRFHLGTAVTIPREDADEDATDAKLTSFDDPQDEVPFEADVHRISDQYIFETVAECMPSLSRVSSVPDFLDFFEEFSGDKEATTKFVVAIAAFFGGNLIARGQWQELLTFIIAFLVVFVFHLPFLARTTSLVLVCYCVNSLKTDGVSVEWAVTVAVVIFLAVLAVMLIRMASKQDPRGYVLLPFHMAMALKEENGKETETTTSVSIWNHLHMDVKVLCFNPTDRVQFIPKGGLLPSNSVVRRGQRIQLKDKTATPYRGPLTVKIFAPFETELGTWSSLTGTWILRATAPPVILSRHPRPLFKNMSEDSVVVVISEWDWTCSLWLPLSQIFARLWHGSTLASLRSTSPCRTLDCEKLVSSFWSSPASCPASSTRSGASRCCVVKSNSHIPLRQSGSRPSRYVLRVYSGLVGSLGLWGGFIERACCILEPGEDVEYEGITSWSSFNSNRKSGENRILDLSAVSSLLSSSGQKDDIAPFVAPFKHVTATRPS
ncbi:Uncharacterized protein SCF082_LOCUS5647 [Durusdinium trenchii]|uniref:Uncharacterized protein n=1 Tax=Durusdinium trenchii TaxID=1381693 RepID=A0ABP0I769_9DINO